MSDKPSFVEIFNEFNKMTEENNNRRLSEPFADLTDEEYEEITMIQDTIAANRDTLDRAFVNYKQLEVVLRGRARVFWEKLGERLGVTGETRIEGRKVYRAPTGEQSK